MRAIVLDRGSVDIDLHLLGGAVSEAACLYRDHQILEVALDPGVYHFVLDSFVSAGVERAGEYLFVVVECEAGDAACG